MFVAVVANQYENGVRPLDPSNMVVKYFKALECCSRGNRVKKDKTLSFAKENSELSKYEPVNLRK